MKSFGQVIRAVVGFVGELALLLVAIVVASVGAMLMPALLQPGEAGELARTQFWLVATPDAGGAIMGAVFLLVVICIICYITGFSDGGRLRDASSAGVEASSAAREPAQHR